MTVRSLKLVDTDKDVSFDSKAHRYWDGAGYLEIFPKLRPGLTVPENFKTDPDALLKQFKLKAIAFGNWVNIEDRLNYIAIAYLSFYDLNKVLRFGFNIGFKNLSVTFGDRGIPGSLAHYNSGNILININRYKRGDKEKEIRFLTSGGVHSFAHEYGHFLDYFAGGIFDRAPNQFACTGGRSVARGRIGINSPIRKKFDDILEKIIWTRPGVELSPYYKYLLKLVDEYGNDVGEYWIRRNELFARAFEKYIQIELAEMGIKNQFLTKSRYISEMYVPDKQARAMVPDFRELIGLIRKKI